MTDEELVDRIEKLERDLEVARRQRHERAAKWRGEGRSLRWISARLGISCTQLGRILDFPQVRQRKANAERAKGLVQGGVSRTDVAERLGVSTRTVRRIVNGR